MMESITLFRFNDETYVHIRWDNGHGVFTNVYMVGPSPTSIEVRNNEIHEYQLNFEDMTIISEKEFNDKKAKI